MVRINFHSRLEDLKDRLLVMAGLAEQAVQRAVDGYTTRDMALCNLVEWSEPALNELEREIHARAVDLLATEQPMATDLRLILAVFRINVDLERVGDQAVAIARRARDMADFPEVDLPVDMLHMGTLAVAMVRRAVSAFAAGNASLAHDVLALDSEVDELNRNAFCALSARLQAHPENTTPALHALLVSRNLERIGDHATNIAEEVIFWIAGTDVRHAPDSRTEEFATLLSAFMQQRHARLEDAAPRRALGKTA